MSEIRVTAELNLAQWYFCLKEKRRIEKHCTHTCFWTAWRTNSLSWKAVFLSISSKCMDSILTSLSRSSFSNYCFLKRLLLKALLLYRKKEHSNWNIRKYTKCDMPKCHIFTNSQNYFSFLAQYFKQENIIPTPASSPQREQTKIILKDQMKVLNAIHRIIE